MLTVSDDVAWRESTEERVWEVGLAHAVAAGSDAWSG
tara:strand:+ start:76 stop:186 length:111 start_codon:yes stop_codon:yes gene_type:complete